MLALVGLLWPRVSPRHGWGFRAATVASFVAWFVPVSWIPALSGNWHYDQPFTLFAVLLAGLALHRLWERFPRWRLAVLAVGLAQMAVLSWGFYDFYRPDLQRAQDRLDGKPAKTLKNTFSNQEIYRYFEQRPDHCVDPRADDASARPSACGGRSPTTSGRPGSGTASGSSTATSAATTCSEFQETIEALHGEIRGEPTLWKDTPDNLDRAGGVLDVLNVGYVLASPGERVAAGLVPLHRFTPARLDRDRGVPQPGPLAGRGRRLAAREGARHVPAPAGLRDPRPALRRPVADPGAARAGPGSPPSAGTARRSTCSSPPRPQQRVLMVSQLYRTGWQARLSDGRTVNGYRLFGGVTGFDIPAGVRSAQILFHPTARIAFASFSWAMLAITVAFLLTTGGLGWASGEARRSLRRRAGSPIR